MAAGGSRCLAIALVCLAGGCGGGGGTASAVVTSLEVAGRVAGGAPLIVSALGGDAVRVIAAGVSANSTLEFGGAAATGLTLVGHDELHAHTPPSPEGIVDVVLTTPGQPETRWPMAVEFLVPPLVTRVAALEGGTMGEAAVPVGAAVLVEVEGSGFRAGSAIYLDGLPISSERISDFLMRFTCPARPMEGEAALEVRIPQGLLASAPEGLFFTEELILDAHADALTREEAAHLFRRGGLGATPADVDRAVAEGLARTLDRLFTIVPDAAVEAEALSVYESLPPRRPVSWRNNQEWWLTLLKRNPNVLQERMAWFLHGHFATSQRLFNTEQLYFMHEQMQLFRSMALGNWREICGAVCSDKAMLVWLDGLLSTAYRPNENFAREFWELFTLGEGKGYTQADILESSRAFTGYESKRDPAIGYDVVNYVPSRHDAGVKTILGATGRFGYDGAVDARDVDGGVAALTLRQRPLEASRFLARKLAAFFLREAPLAPVVEELATDLRDADWELRPVLRRLLGSRAFFSARTRRSRISSPVEFAVNFLRCTGIDMPAATLNDALEAMGQSVLEPPSVAGWPRGGAWLSQQSLVERVNFLRDALLSFDSSAVAAISPSNLVDFHARALDIALAAAERSVLIEYATTTDSQITGKLTSAQAVTKSRGILYLLGQHPDALRE